MEEASDQAAVDAMRRELNNLPIDGTVVIGEGEIDEAPMLFIGEKVGNTRGPQVDIAVDPLEGTVLCAKNMPGAIATIAMAKLARCFTRRTATWTRSRSVRATPTARWISTRRWKRTSCNLAKAKGVKPTEITAILLDRPRHAAKIAALRKTRRRGEPYQRRRRRRRHPHRRAARPGIDIYLGSGGAPEGVLSAAALRCIGGQMQTRLIIDSEALRERTLQMGIEDARKNTRSSDMVKGDCLFAATGVTSGSLLSGVRFRKNGIETETVVMRSATETMRRIKAEHRKIDKFDLD